MYTKLFRLIFVYIFCFSAASAQTPAQTIVQQLNKNIQQAYQPFILFEKTGSLEQTQDGIAQRFKITEIDSFQLSKQSEGYIVNLFCNDNAGCISVIKNNTLLPPLNSTSFFFGSVDQANSFIQSLQQLKQLYQSNQNTSSSKGTANTSVKNQTAESNMANENNNVIPPPRTSTSAVNPIINHPKQTQVSDVEDDEIEDKIIPTKQNNKDLKQKKSTANHEENETDDIKKTTVSNVNKSSNNLCDQLQQILSIAFTNQFDQIQGKENNAEKKIYESKFKLKGAKRNYLHPYQQKNAFIAEYKTSADYEGLMIDFDNLQNEIEACLGGDWDNNDMANNSEYDNFKGDVRDVEYAHIDKKITATIRIILLSDENNKSTLFIRVQ